MYPETDPRQLVFLLLKFLGVDDAQKAFDCDRDVCNELLIKITVCDGDGSWSKFLDYMRS